MTALSYRYGLGRPLDWGPDCEAELARMRALWNRLVEIEEEHRRAIHAATADDPAVMAATGRAQAAQQRLDALKAQRTEANKAARKKVPQPELDREIEEARAEAARAWNVAKDARRQARAAKRNLIARISAARLDAVKAARQSSGLYWGNYNAVIASYETARGRPGATLRRRERPGVRERIVNQVQDGATWDDALSARGLHGVAWVTPHDLTRRRSGRLCPEYRLRWTVYTRDGERRTVTAPLYLHRPLPAGAIIKSLTVSRVRRPPRRDEWCAVFSVDSPTAPPARKPTRAIGIDIGWRRLNDGIRVAMGIDTDGERTQIVLPERSTGGQQSHRWALAEAAVPPAVAIALRLMVKFNITADGLAQALSRPARRPRRSA